MPPQETEEEERNGQIRPFPHISHHLYVRHKKVKRLQFVEKNVFLLPILIENRKWHFLFSIKIEIKKLVLYEYVSAYLQH